MCVTVCATCIFWRCMRCRSIYDARSLGATCEWVWPRRPPRGAVKRSRCDWRQHGASGHRSGGMSVAGFVPWCPLQRIEVYRDSDESWLLGSLTGQQELSVICDRSGHRHYRDRDIATSCLGLPLSHIQRTSARKLRAMKLIRPWKYPRAIHANMVSVMTTPVAVVLILRVLVAVPLQYYHRHQ